VGLYEWAIATGYRWLGWRCAIGQGGTEILPTDYLPRRLMGEYLAWFYATLIEDAPPNLEIVRHAAAAVDISPEIGGRETVTLSNGTRVSVEHVVLTSGHTWNAERQGEGVGVHFLRPYPVEYFEKVFLPGEPVAIAGMGLVGFDLLTALTVGRGGSYEDDGQRKHYVASGREPNIFLYSRSGVPYSAKSAHGVDPYGDYQPVSYTHLDVYKRQVIGSASTNMTRFGNMLSGRSFLRPLMTSPTSTSASLTTKATMPGSS